MKTRIYLYAVLMLGLLAGRAQNNFFFSHHMFNPSYYNPAYTGINDVGDVTFLYRNQWTGYSTTFDGPGGAPETQILTFQVPVHAAGIAGVGLNASYDQLGLERNTQINFLIAGAFQMRNATLRVGLMPGIFIKGINGNKLDPNDPNDPVIPGKVSQMNPDLGVGISFETNKGLNLGMSVLHTMEPEFDLNTNSLEYFQRRTYVVNGRTKYQLNESMTLLPSVIVRSNLSSVTFDAGTLLTFSNSLWTGLSYRLEESLILFLGYSLLDNRLKLGYSFDYVVHNQDAKNPTSHEIYVRYILPELVIGGRKKVKTPRFSY